MLTSLGSPYTIIRRAELDGTLKWAISGRVSLFPCFPLNSTAVAYRQLEFGCVYYSPCEPFTRSVTFEGNKWFKRFFFIRGHFVLASDVFREVLPGRQHSPSRDCGAERAEKVLRKDVFDSREGSKLITNCSAAFPRKRIVSAVFF